MTLLRPGYVVPALSNEEIFFVRRPSGNIVPAHFIQRVTATHQGKTVLSAQGGLTVTWTDNKRGDQDR